MSGVLIFLWESDRKKQHDIADHLCKDKGGITKIIDSLEKRGFVTRQADAQDGRNKIVTLTQAGHELKNKVLFIRNELLDKMIYHISNQELDVTKHILTDIIEHLK
jgi:DNA-binding MarR family transcriptional regulator